MSALQQQGMFQQMSFSRRFMPQHQIEKFSSNNISRPSKKLRPTTMSASGEDRLSKAKTFVETDIAGHKVVVYAKTWCPHCNKTKELLSKDEFKGVDILIRDVDTIEEPSGPALQMALTKVSGQKSVPNIFIDGKHFGGNSDLQEAYAAGTLKLV
mmetsp:Transcript_20366/g.41942  ORF Transcript_20366/g.41942 Transcript_20366/m.41942 type:complete len:155 (-) Transcript_20366:2233-2697(-)